jgi:hypothetical protein
MPNASLKPNGLPFANPIPAFVDISRSRFAQVESPRQTTHVR